jgi:hypothetical protein
MLNAIVLGSPFSCSAVINRSGWCTLGHLFDPDRSRSGKKDCRWTGQQTDPNRPYLPAGCDDFPQLGGSKPGVGATLTVTF